MKGEIMADIGALLERIDGEFAAGEQKIKSFQAEKVQAYEDRQRRLKLFEQVCEKLREVWRPRLDALAQKFGQRVKVTPQIVGALREVKFEFDSNLARIDLRFRASTDQEVKKLVLDYDLDILPVLMRFEPHAQAEFPLETIDVNAVAKWIDDRIVDFVRAYLALHQNEFYLK